MAPIDFASSPLILLLVLVLTVAGCAGSREIAAPIGEQSAQHLEVAGRTMDYLLYLPEGYGQQEAWPLVLFLHGAGERGDSLDLVKKHGPPKLIAQGWSFPFIVISPQHPKGSWWQTDRLLAFLDAVMETYHVDEARVYVTGLSMGGFGTWGLATEAPQRFAAVAPISGGGDSSLVCAMRDVPVWAFHGTKDPVVPVERSREMVEALHGCASAAEVRYTEYPEAGHDAWTQTYDHAALYTWLLSHHR